MEMVVLVAVANCRRKGKPTGPSRLVVVVVVLAVVVVVVVVVIEPLIFAVRLC